MFNARLQYEEPDNLTTISEYGPSNFKVKKTIRYKLEPECLYRVKSKVEEVLAESRETGPIAYSRDMKSR